MKKNYWDLKVEKANLVDKAQAILDASPETTLSLEASKKFDGILEKIDVVNRELEQSQTERDGMLRAAQMQISQNPSFSPVGGIYPIDHTPGYEHMAPRIQHRVPHLKAFPNTSEGQRDAYLAGHWYKAVVCQHRGNPCEASEDICSSAGFPVRMVAGENTPSSGGYLVPSPLANTIIDVRAQAGVARRVCRVVPMTSDSHSEPKLESGPTVVYVGENDEFTASDETWGQVALYAKKRGILSRVSNELRDDALISVVDQLASRMGHEFALKEDSEFIDGDATSAYGGVNGLLNSIGSAGVVDAATNHDTWPELTMADFTAAMGKLPSKYSQGASWICSANFYFSAMLNALAAGGGNSMTSLAQGVDMGLFLGKPVYFTDYMPTTTAASTVSCLYGNFAEAMILGDRIGVEIAISEQRYFEFDQIGVRGKVRYDFNCHEAGDSSNVGAFVALKTAASE